MSVSDLITRVAQQQGSNILDVNNRLAAAALRIAVNRAVVKLVNTIFDKYLTGEFLVTKTATSKVIKFHKVKTSVM